MTPSEKLAKVKQILDWDEEVVEDGKSYTICHHAGGNLDGVIQDLKYNPEYGALKDDDVILNTLRRVQKQIYDALDVIDQPEVNLGDRFPHITHHDEHQSK